MTNAVPGGALPLIAVAAASGSPPNLIQWGRYQIMPPGQNGQLTPIPQPAGFTGEGGPYAMNKNGDMAGWYTLADGTRNAMAWTPEHGLRDLNVVVGASGWFLRAAFGMNNARMIVGFGTHNGLHRAFRLNLTTSQIIDLGTLEPPHETLSYNATAINRYGHIVGTAGLDGDGVGYHLHGRRAFIYTDQSGMTDLNELVLMPPGWVLESADGINDNDEVIGIASSVSQGLRRAYKVKVPNLPATICVGQPNGTACDDGNSCTQTDVCQGGLCAGSNNGTVCLTGTTVLTCPQGSTMNDCVDTLVTRVALSTRDRVSAVTNDLQTIANYPGLPEAIAADTQTHINPSGPFNHTLVEIAMLGEMKAAAGTQVLKNIVHMPLPTTGTCVSDHGNTAPCADLKERQYLRGIQAKAIDGLAFLRNAEGDAEVLAAVANGANPTMQARAVMAYLWNHGATEANRAMLAGLLPPERRFLADRFIKDANTTPAALSQALTDFYNRHPELVPPQP
jgi:probable HAF family extracellular repeat protein